MKHASFNVAKRLITINVICARDLKTKHAGNGIMKPFFYY